jgi:hypothetical protein
MAKLKISKQVDDTAKVMSEHYGLPYESKRLVGQSSQPMLNIDAEFNRPSKEADYKPAKLKLKKVSKPKIKIQSGVPKDMTLEEAPVSKMKIAPIPTPELVSEGSLDTKIEDLEVAAAPEQNAIQEMYDVKPDETVDRLTKREMEYKESRGDFPWFTALAPIIGGAIGGRADIGAKYAGEALLKEEEYKRKLDSDRLKSDINRELAKNKAIDRYKEKEREHEFQMRMLGKKGEQAAEMEGMKQEGKTEILGQKLKGQKEILGQKMDLAERKFDFTKTAHGDKMKIAGGKLAQKIAEGKAKREENWTAAHPSYTKFIREKAIPKFQTAVKTDMESLNTLKKVEKLINTKGTFPMKLALRSIMKMVEEGRLSNEDAEYYEAEFAKIAAIKKELIRQKTNKLDPKKRSEVVASVKAMQEVLTKTLRGKANDSAKAYFLNNPELTGDAAKRFLAYAGVQGTPTPKKVDYSGLTKEKIDNMSLEDIKKFEAGGK